MKNLIAIIAVALAFCASADAEVWKWVDEHGTVHFGDKPQHESASSHRVAFRPASGRSSRSLSNPRPVDGRGDPADESDSETMNREDAEQYYCQQAKEIHSRYSSAARLYRTNAEGQREYLSDAEAAAAIAEANASIAEWCH